MTDTVSLGVFISAVFWGVFWLVAPLGTLMLACAAWAMLKDVVVFLLTDSGDGRRVPPA